MEGSRETVLAGRTLVPGCLFLGVERAPAPETPGNAHLLGSVVGTPEGRRLKSSSASFPVCLPHTQLVSSRLPAPTCCVPQLRHQNELLCQSTDHKTHLLDSAPGPRKSFSRRGGGGGDVAQRLGILGALPEDSNPVPSIHI